VFRDSIPGTNTFHDFYSTTKHIYLGELLNFMHISLRRLCFIYDLKCQCCRSRKQFGHIARAESESTLIDAGFVVYLLGNWVLSTKLYYSKQWSNPLNCICQIVYAKRFDAQLIIREQVFP